MEFAFLYCRPGKRTIEWVSNLNGREGTFVGMDLDEARIILISEGWRVPVSVNSFQEPATMMVWVGEWWQTYPFYK